jgi:hypothetical protein
MASKQKKRKKPTKKPIQRRKRRSAPKRNPGRSRRAATRAKSIFTALKIQESVIDASKQVGGMMAAQFFAKRFADGGGANDVAWSWKNYLWATTGAFAAGIGAETIKKGSGKEFLKGGLALIGYKLITNELAPKSPFIQEYFGADNSQGAFLGEDGETYEPGDQYLGQDGEVYLLGANGEWSPINDAYRMGPMSGTLAPPGDLGAGGYLVDPSDLGDDGYLVDPSDLGEDDPYQAAYGDA